MSSRRTIFLVGMPGCGKSTLACALAAAGLCVMADLDTAVERRAGMSVARIMATLGEPAFRRMETEALAEVAEGAGGTLPLVVSTGGGVPCHGDNMDRMLAAGTVVWLQSGAERTVRRLAEAPGQRPAADRAMAQGRLRRWHDELLAERTPAYARAHATFDTTELDDVRAVAAAVERFRRQFNL